MFTLRTFQRAAMLLALPATALLASPASAQSDIVVTYGPNSSAVTKAMPVDLSDLNLSNSKGRAKAERRILTAVKMVCSQKQIYSTEGERDYRRCYSEAKSAAMANAGLVQTASR